MALITFKCRRKGKVFLGISYYPLAVGLMDYFVPHLEGAGRGGGDVGGRGGGRFELGRLGHHGLGQGVPVPVAQNGGAGLEAVARGKPNGESQGSLDFIPEPGHIPVAVVLDGLFADGVDLPGEKMAFPDGPEFGGELHVSQRVAGIRREEMALGISGSGRGHGWPFRRPRAGPWGGVEEGRPYCLVKMAVSWPDPGLELWGFADRATMWPDASI